MAHWQYFLWAGYFSAALGVLRFLPLAIVRLAAAFTRDETRHRQCMEVLRLTRRDAARIPPYNSGPSREGKLRTRRTSVPKQAR